MAKEDSDKTYVTFDGKTVVDTDALLRTPKVRRTFEKLSKRNESQRGRPGVVFLRPLKSEP
jgi:hypothetical protein